MLAVALDKLGSGDDDKRERERSHSFVEPSPWEPKPALSSETGLDRQQCERCSEWKKGDERVDREQPGHDDRRHRTGSPCVTNCQLYHHGDGHR